MANKSKKQKSTTQAAKQTQSAAPAKRRQNRREIWANTHMNTLRRIGEFRRLFLFPAAIASRVFPVEKDSVRKANMTARITPRQTAARTYRPLPSPSGERSKAPCKNAACPAKETGRTSVRPPMIP